MIAIIKFKYLNNIVEPDNRFIQRIIWPMLDFNAF